MSTTAKNAIIKAKIDGVVSELLVKTNAANVYVDDNTTLASKLSSIIADIATKASTEELTNGLAGKADAAHTHKQADVIGLADTLASKSDVGHKHNLADINEVTVMGNTRTLVPQAEAATNMTQFPSYVGLGETAGNRTVLTVNGIEYISSTGATTADNGFSYTLVVSNSDGVSYTLTENQMDTTTNITPAISSGATYKLTTLATIPVIDEKYIDSSIVRNADLTTALAGKANTSHTHAQSEITGLTDALALLASTESVTAAIDALRQEMLGDTPVDAYNTFTELAAYIAEHKEVSDALTAAVGNKADKATTLAGYGIGDAYTKTEVDTKISEAIETATGGESAASVKFALDNYKTSNDTRVDALEANTHAHANKAVLDNITADKVSAWDAKTKVYYSAEEPANLTENDLWVQIVE